MKCFICGTIRDCGKYLDKIVENMEKIGSLFDEYVIFFYYDDSKDNTLEKLKQYNRTHKNINFFINNEPLLPYRTFRLAKGRNKCMEFLRNNYTDFKYFIVMDCDDICARNMNINVLQNALKRNDWDSLSFQHPEGYYDAWALSKRPYIISCHHINRPDSIKLYNNYIENIIKKTDKDKLIPCLSAFNGFAIYRTEKFKNCFYDGRFRLNYLPPYWLKKNIEYTGKLNLTNVEDCEHRFFHISACFKNNALIFISPLCFFK